MKKYLYLIPLLFTANAFAVDYQIGDFDLSLDVEGMIGTLGKKIHNYAFINDWDVKGQVIYHINEKNKIGAVYSLDSECVGEDEYIHDAFLLYENKNMGRIELGLTHSIARKLGLGLPDVGGLRINEKSILYKKMPNEHNVISDTTITSGHEALRLNIATKSTHVGQYGISVSGLSDSYDYNVDFAFKIKQPHGKIKTAYSFGLSFIDNPKNYEENSFTSEVNADWRGQAELGFNMHYNSYVFSVSSRLIYDKNPIGINSDGLVVGTGVSYDFLNYTLSVNYLFSDTGIWNHYTDKKIYNTVLSSVQYKYTENTSMFISGGVVNSNPFLSAGLKVEF